MDEITTVVAALRPQGDSARPDAEGASGTDFAQRLLDAVADADRLQRQADGRVQDLARGEGDTVETMVALSKADLALRFVVELRNRALEAYQELMRMQV